VVNSAEVHWLRINKRNKHVHVHWPERRTVTTEWNVYYDKTSASVSRLGVEEREILETQLTHQSSRRNFKPLPPLPNYQNFSTMPPNPLTSQIVMRTTPRVNHKH